MTRLVCSILGMCLVLAAGGCGSGQTQPATATSARPGGDVPTPPDLAPDLFEDVTARSGVDFRYRNGEEVSPAHLSILESLGGGLAVIDYDGDGLLDLFLPGGGHFGGPDNKTILGHPCRLYRNRGNFQFEDVTAAAGLGSLEGGKPWFYTHGAAVADYDRDGYQDLLVTGYGRLALFHNEPDGRGGRKFVDVSAKAGLGTGVTWTTSAGWADFDGDGLPDFYACQYVDWSFANHPACNYDGTTPDVCPPKKFDGLQQLVYRNNGDGTFTEVGQSAGLQPGGPKASKGLGVVVVDVNGDGKPDIWAANDTVPKFLYINKSTRGTLKFEEAGMAAGVAVDGYGNPNGSMGVDAGDPARTGQPWLFCTNYENELHALYKNISKPDRAFFLFNTPASGMAALGQKFVGWGTGFVDLDHDGWEDIVIVNGHAIRFPATTTRSQKSVIMRNTGGGKFRIESDRGGAYFRADHLSRGMVLADFDNDGRVDLAVANVNEPTAILRNVAPAGNHWLGVQLIGKGNGDVVGARVQLTNPDGTQSRFAKGGGSYASSPDRRMVFGLGPADKAAKLSVEWPDGTKQEFADVAADRYVRLTQGEAALRPLAAGAK